MKTEYERAVEYARLIVAANPDSNADLIVLARQFLQLVELIGGSP
jgi:hypothetical protein